MLQTRDSFLLMIQDYLINKFGCHTILLYGSFVQESAEAVGDVDIIAVRETGRLKKISGCIEGKFLDAFIYSEKEIKIIDSTFIRLWGGVVLKQKDNLGDKIIKAVNEMYLMGPAKTPDWEKKDIKNWLYKMSLRAKSDTLISSYRKNWLIFTSLEYYFRLRDLWYMGPRKSFSWLKDNDFETYQLFEKVLAKSNDILIDELTCRVTNCECIPKNFQLDW